MLLPRPATGASIFRTISTSILPSSHIASESTHFLDELRVLCTRGHLTEALSLFYTLPLPHSQQIYATLFHACAKHGCLQKGEALHHHMLTHNLNCAPDLYTTNHLINMYAKCGSLEYARKLFDEMPHRNIVSWTAVISGYAQQSRADECFSLFSEMLYHWRPTEFAYASVLTVCDGDRGGQVFKIVDSGPKL